MDLRAASDPISPVASVLSHSPLPAWASDPGSDMPSSRYDKFNRLRVFYHRVQGENKVLKNEVELLQSKCSNMESIISTREAPKQNPPSRRKSPVEHCLPGNLPPFRSLPGEHVTERDPQLFDIYSEGTDITGGGRDSIAGNYMSGVSRIQTITQISNALSLAQSALLQLQEEELALPMPTLMASTTKRISKKCAFRTSAASEATQRSSPLATAGGTVQSVLSSTMMESTSLRRMSRGAFVDVGTQLELGRNSLSFFSRASQLDVGTKKTVRTEEIGTQLDTGRLSLVATYAGPEQSALDNIFASVCAYRGVLIGKGTLKVNAQAPSFDQDISNMIESIRACRRERPFPD